MSSQVDLGQGILSRHEFIKPDDYESQCEMQTDAVKLCNHCRT